MCLFALGGFFLLCMLMMINWSSNSCLFAGCGGHWPGFHCLHWSHVHAAWQPLLVGALLPDAAQFRPQHHVWNHGGHPGPPHRPLQNPGQQQDQTHRWVVVTVRLEMSSDAITRFISNSILMKNQRNSFQWTKLDLFDASVWFLVGLIC